MKISEIRNNAFAMPFTSPSYSKGPYRFMNREFFIITYRTDTAIKEKPPTLFTLVARLLVGPLGLEPGTKGL